MKLFLETTVIIMYTYILYYLVSKRTIWKRRRKFTARDVVDIKCTREWKRFRDN